MREAQSIGTHYLRVFRAGDKPLTDTSAESHIVRQNSWQAAPRRLFEVFEYKNDGVNKQENDRPVCDHGFTHFALEVDGDIDEVYAELEKAGVDWHSPPVGRLDEEGYRVTYGRDPFGNVIEIQKLSTKNPGHISYLPHWKP